MPAVAGLGQSQEPGTSSWLFTWVAGSQLLEASSIVSLAHKQEGELKAEEQRLKPGTWM